MIDRGARISDDGLYRYELWRTWPVTLDAASPARAAFIMLNPSTADATVDDPTIRRCIGFAKALGCNGLTVANLYAYRATKPADLWRAADPVGPDNDDTLRGLRAAADHTGSPLIAAWGAHAKPDRVEQVRAILGDNLLALGVTKDGAPRHPLYLPATARPVRWEP